MHRVSGITVVRCSTTKLARLVQTSAVNVRDYAFVGDSRSAWRIRRMVASRTATMHTATRCTRSTTPATRSSENDQHLADDTRAEAAKTVPLAHLGFATKV